jgi:hypothetical protein
VVWRPKTPFLVPILSRQQDCIVFELLPAEPVGQAPHRTAMTRLYDIIPSESTFALTLPFPSDPCVPDQRTVPLTLTMLHSAAASPPSLVADAPLPSLHPPSPSKSKKTTPTRTPLARSRESSPTRRPKSEGDPSLPCLQLELRFVEGLGKAFDGLDQIMGTPAARGASARTSHRAMT